MARLVVLRNFLSALETRHHVVDHRLGLPDHQRQPIDEADNVEAGAPNCTFAGDNEGVAGRVVEVD